MAGGGGAHPGMGSEAHPDKKTKRGHPGRVGVARSYPGKGAHPAAPRRPQSRAGSRRAVACPPGGAGSGRGTPPLRLVFLSSPPPPPSSLPARLPGMVEGVGSTRQGGPGRGGRLAPAPATARGAARGGLRRLGVPQPPPPPPLPVMAKDVLGGGSRGGC